MRRKLVKAILVALMLLIALVAVGCTRSAQESRLQPISDPIRPEMFVVDWIDEDLTVEEFEATGNYIEKDEDEDGWFCSYTTDSLTYSYMLDSMSTSESQYKLTSITITKTDIEKGVTGPLGICIGDSYEDLIEVYPEVYFTPNTEDTYTENNFVSHGTVAGEKRITFVPETVAPFMLVEFEGDYVSEIRISQWAF